MDTGEKFKAARTAAGLTQEQAEATREKVCWCTCCYPQSLSIIIFLSCLLDRRRRP